MAIILYVATLSTSEIRCEQRIAHAQIAGMGRWYGMWARAEVTRVNAAKYCRYWVAHPRVALTGGSQSRELSHRHSATLAAL